jgi:phage terminase large subunit-like protein
MSHPSKTSPSSANNPTVASQLADALQDGGWAAKARPNQLPPLDPWSIWLVLAGRGFGKTRTGAEWVRTLVETGAAGRIALVAPTAGDCRDIMLEGSSGVLTISPDWNRPLYEPSKRRLTWPNGAQATLFSAEESDHVGDGYVLEDCSGRYQPHEWAAVAIAMYRRWNADRIIAEKNNGGDMVEATIRSVDQNVSFKAVHASRGKVRGQECSGHGLFLRMLQGSLCRLSSGGSSRSIPLAEMPLRPGVLF